MSQTTPGDNIPVRTFTLRATRPAISQERVQALAAAARRVHAFVPVDSPTPFAEGTRPRSNLVISKRFRPADLNVGAMWFYTCQARYGSRANNTLVFASLVYGLLWPGRQQKHGNKAEISTKLVRSAIAVCRGGFNGRSMNTYTYVRPKDDGYEVDIPAVWVALSPEILNPIARGLYNLEDNQTFLGTDPVPIALNRFWPHSELESIPGVSSSIGAGVQIINRMRSIPGSGLVTRVLEAKFRRGGNLISMDGVLLSLRLFFTKEQLEIMCQQEFLHIRPMDVYGLMRALADKRVGGLGSPSLYTLPISQIARTLPPGGKSRLDPDSRTAVDENGDFWWLPTKEENVSRADTEMVGALRRKDGSYGLAPVDGESPQDIAMARPKSGLILADWVNFRLSYINGEGEVRVRATERWVPTAPRHIHAFLASSAFLKSGDGHPYLSWWSIVGSIGPRFGGTYQETLNGAAPLTGSLLRWKRKVEEESPSDKKVLEAKDITVQDLYDASVQTYDPNLAAAMKSFFTNCERLLAYADHSAENLFADTSFSTICKAVAFTRLFVTWAPKYVEIRDLARKENEVYADQTVDKNYEVPPLPFLGGDEENPRALQPHQFRVASRLRNSPNFAILAVDAGGGKTISILTDMSKEMKLGHARRCLIMCPRHLVAQYVKEVLYFTNAQVNVIAVNTYTMTTHGVDGLVEMMMKAPPNTVVVLDYDLANGPQKSFQLCYGTQMSRAYPLVDALRRMMFDYVALDESHTVRNWMANLTKATARMITDIPIKRLASGTLTPKSILDLVTQIGLMDPTIFPKKDFDDTYLKMVERKGRKVPVYDAAAIRARIESRVQFIQVKRKEWAAYLPRLSESTYVVDLTDAQREVYNLILGEELEKLREKIAKNAKLREFLESGGTNMDGGEELDGEDADLGANDSSANSEDTTDDDNEMVMAAPADGVSMEKLLSASLHRLESFSAGPALDVLGDKMLTGKDRAPPKLAMLARLIKKHLAMQVEPGSELLDPPETNADEDPSMYEIPSEPTPGKILVFFNYHQEVEGIFAGLAEFYPELLPLCIKYSASTKAENAAQFEKDPTKMVMIGIESSMNTGLNLQFASRLIRASSVWTPGALEQGNARVLRPNIKSPEKRSTVFIDWLVCNGTIDVTKQAFLLTRKLHITKFEEVGNPNYAKLQPPPLLRMNLETIASSNTARAEDIADVFAEWKAARAMQDKDYREFADAHKEDIGPDGRPLMHLLKKDNPLPHSKLMHRVPYVPGIDLFGEEELGLVRYDQFVKIDEADLEEDGGDENDDGGSALDEERNKVIGQGAYCEHGEGVISRVMRFHVRVDLAMGKSVRVHKLACWIMTKANTTNMDMRSALLKQIGELPPDTPPFRVVPVNEAPAGRTRSKDTPLPQSAPSEPRVASTPFVLRIAVVNGFPGLLFGQVGFDRAVRILEAKGFAPPPDYFFARVANPRIFLALFKAWKEAGFFVDASFSAACRDAYVAFVQMASGSEARMTDYVKMASRADLRNFVRMVIKPEPHTKTICPYPMMREDRFNIALPIAGHPGSMNAVRVAVPGIKWQRSDPDSMRQIFFNNLQELDEAVRSIMAVPGVQIRNMDELTAQRKELHAVRNLLDRTRS